MELKENKPLYQQIATKIQSDIYMGKYKPEQQLPTETELCERFSVSKSTIRKAIQILVDKSLLKKIRGKGTFVLYRKENMTLGKNSLGFNDFLAPKGHKTDVQILKTSIINEDNQINRKLHLSSGTNITLISRLIVEDDSPVAIDNIYVETERFPKIIENLSNKKSLYEVLKNEYQININKSNLKINGIVANAHMANILQCTMGDPLFVLDKISLVDDDIIHYSKSFVRCDRVEYSFSI